jgi:hypothetical protein
VSLRDVLEHDERNHRRDNDLPGEKLAKIRAIWAKRTAELVERDHTAALIIEDARFPKGRKVQQIREGRG